MHSTSTSTLAFRRCCVTLVAAVTAALGASSAHAAGSVAYVSGSGGTFGTLDLDTGSFTALGSSGINLAGLGVVGGTLYGLSYGASSAQLYKVRTTDGSLTAVGAPDGQNFYDFGATPTGLYGVTTDGKLYGISPLDGHITLVGSLGISLSLRVESLSSNSPTLYFINGSDLYILSTTTGAASFIGTAGGTIGAMTMSGGTLYGGDSGTPKSVVTINTATGVGTVTHSVSGGSFGNYQGLAAVSAVPEPAAWLLFAAGTAALLFRRRTLSSKA